MISVSEFLGIKKFGFDEPPGQLQATNKNEEMQIGNTKFYNFHFFRFIF